jgi:hypothetical protein
MRLSEECGLESRADSERWAFWHALRDALTDDRLKCPENVTTRA